MTDNPFRKDKTKQVQAAKAAQDASFAPKPGEAGEDIRSEMLKEAKDVCPLLTTPALQFQEVPMAAKLGMGLQRDLPAIPVLAMSLNFCIRDSCAMWSAEDGGGCSIKRGMEALYRGAKEKKDAERQPADA